jgi:transposase-like protein
MALKKDGKKDWTRAELKRLKSVIEDLYINKDYTLEQIAAEFDISVQTLSKWKKGEKDQKTWDERKVFVQLTPTRLKEMLLGEALSISEGKEPTFKADSISKIMAAVDRLDKRVNPRTVITVMKNFDKWMVDIDPAKAVEFVKFHRMFIQYVISQED